MSADLHNILESIELNVALSENNFFQQFEKQHLRAEAEEQGARTQPGQQGPVGQEGSAGMEAKNAKLSANLVEVRSGLQLKFIDFP